MSAPLEYVQNLFAEELAALNAAKPELGHVHAHHLRPLLAMFGYTVALRGQGYVLEPIAIAPRELLLEEEH